MNKYLLDTHIFLWCLLEPACLKADLAKELENPANELWLSPITTWEVIILCERGRLVLDDHPATWMRNALDTLPFREATLNHAVAIQSRRLRLPHQDPADRFIAASAMVHGLTLMTADRNLIEGAGMYSVFANC
ncbi:MAG: type II toxin-antitoxin system VapC family toxin [Desulfatitalea sp.]